MRSLRGVNMASIRWAFPFTDWKPKINEWILAGQCVQPEEKERISRFVFQRDAKSAMTGRLLLRKCIHQELSIPYDGILLKRTDKGKPFLSNDNPPECKEFNFNVSHQGDFSVLAAEHGRLVGIDVMKVDEPRGTRIDEFFDRMSRQFTTQEWQYIKSGKETLGQLARFYRLWCLKESYVKALGIGIGFELKRIDFHIGTADLIIGQQTADTLVHIDGKLENDWTFEETRLDKDHYVAVATKGINASEKASGSKRETVPQFSLLSFAELIEGAETQDEPDLLFWQNFNAKSEKPGG